MKAPAKSCKARQGLSNSRVVVGPMSKAGWNLINPRVVFVDAQRNDIVSQKQIPAFLGQGTFVGNRTTPLTDSHMRNGSPPMIAERSLPLSATLFDRNSK